MLNQPVESTATPLSHCSSESLLCAAILCCLEQGLPVALLIVVASSGSSPELFLVKPCMLVEMAVKSNWAY